MDGQDVVATLECRECSTTFECTERDRIFLDKMSVPQPTLCPNCRHRRRLAHNNEMNLYRRSCDKTGDTILSTISADKPYSVYKQEVWWGDSWDGRDYGRDFDFGRPFFEQYQELCLVVPHVSLQNNYLLDVNAEYTNYAGSNKDCYLIFHADYDRDCYYGYGVKKCESCVDVYNVFDSELLYECIDCRQCYHLLYSQNCVNCYDSYFLRDCIACKNCIGCKNLRQKQYYIFNKPYSKEEYFEALKRLDLGSRACVEALRKRFTDFCAELPNRHLRMIQTESSRGDQLFQCRGVTESYDVSEMHDGRHCYQIYNGAKDCMDMYQFGLNAELVYEGSIIGYNCHMIRFCHMCNEQVSDLTYCQDCYHSQDLFGCFGLRHKSHCILNKQYSKEDYQALVSKIIAHMQETGEWGEFFPIEHSPFAYNETTAQMYFPLEKAQAVEAGYGWQDDVGTATVVDAVDTPVDSITDVDDAVTKTTFRCEQSGRGYKIIEPELAFYQKMGVPLPVRCFAERHQVRVQRRNPRALRSGTCDSCGEALQTSYPAESESRVFCEACYLEALD